MGIDHVNPDKQPNPLHGTSRTNGPRGVGETEDDKISSNAVLYEILRQLSELAEAAKNGDIIDGIKTGGNISQELRALVESFYSREITSDPSAFFTKLIELGADALYLPVEHGASIFNRIREALSPILNTLDDKLNFAKGLVLAFSEMEHGPKGMDELLKIASNIIGIADPNLKTIQDQMILYMQNLGDVIYKVGNLVNPDFERILNGLSLIADNLEVGNIGQGGIKPGPLGRDGSKIIEAVAELIDAIENEEFKTDPNSFFKKLLNVFADDNQIPRGDAKGAVTQEIKSILFWAFKDLNSQTSLALSLAEAYRQITGGTEDTSELKSILNNVFGDRNPAVKTALSEYDLAIKNGGPIPNIEKNQEVLNDDVIRNGTWQEQYDALLKEIALGRLPLDLLEEVYRNAPPGSEKDMKMLSKHLEPLVMLPEVQKAFAEYLAMYAAQEGSLAAAEQKAGEIIAMIQQYSHPRHGDSFNKLRDLTSEALTGAGGPFNASSPLSQADIANRLSETKADFNNIAKVPLKNRYILYNAPIMMAMFVLLMSKDGAYGYLASVMSNLNATMKEIKKYTQGLTDINNSLSKFMKETDPEKQLELLKEIQKSRNDIRELLKANPETFGEDLRNKINDFVKPEGTLDDLLRKGSYNTLDGTIYWSQPPGEPLKPDYMKQLQDYLTSSSGGAAGEGVTTTISEISNLLGAVNTHNQAQLEKLNMITKKIDALTKLFSSAITMYKGLIQTLTQYSGS